VTEAESNDWQNSVNDERLQSLHFQADWLQHSHTQVQCHKHIETLYLLLDISVNNLTEYYYRINSGGVRILRILSFHRVSFHFKLRTLKVVWQKEQVLYDTELWQW